MPIFPALKSELTFFVSPTVLDVITSTSSSHPSISFELHFNKTSQQTTSVSTKNLKRRVIKFSIECGIYK